MHAHSLHERFFCQLHLPHLQLDELRTRLRSHNHILWLWLAIDPCTKILPVLHLGPRTQHMAHLLIHSLRESLAPGCLPLFTSDGLNLYFYALTAHFGQWLEVGWRGQKMRRWQVAPGLIYGQMKKCYRRRKLVRVTHVMRLGTEDALKVARPRIGLLWSVERLSPSDRPFDTRFAGPGAHSLFSLQTPWKSPCCPYKSPASPWEFPGHRVRLCCFVGLAHKEESS